MKQKIQNNFFAKCTKTILLSSFMLSQIFIFTFNLPTANAQSGCTFRIDSMEAKPTVVTKDSEITFNATVTQIGTGPSCEPYVNSTFKFYATVACTATDGPDCTSSWKELTAISVAFRQSQTRTVETRPYTGLKNFDFNTLSNPNVLPYHMVVFSNGRNQTDTTSWNKSLAISGQTTTGGSGVLQANISLDQPFVSPTGPDLKITVNMSDSDIGKLPLKIAMLTYINGKLVGNNYGPNNEGIPTSYLKNSGTYQTLKTNLTNVFKDGPLINDIRVDIHNGTAPFALYASATGKITGQGYTPSTPPGTLPVTPSGTPPGITPGGPPVLKVDCLATPNSPDCLYNPLPTGDLTTMFLLIAKGTLGLTAVWAVIFIIVGGFRMVTSAGNEEAYGVAKKTVTWAILGVVIAVLSFSMVAIVEDLLKANIADIRGTTGTTPK